MSQIEVIILNLIFILFSNFIYTLYLANKQNLKESENKILLDFSLLLSLFLIINYSNYYETSNLIIFFLFIILISILYKRMFPFIFTSFIIGEYIFRILHISPIIIIIFFVSVLILYLVFKSDNKKLVISYITYTTILLIITSILLDKNMISISFNLISYYFITFICLMWIKKTKEILELQNTLKDFKSEKQLKVSLFKIVHEIKNPIAVIKGYLSMMDTKNKDKTDKYLGIVKSETERTINLLDDFMQFSKIELKCELFDYSNLMVEIKNIVIPLLDNKKLIYEFKLEEGILINGDANRLKQVIVNIIKNACEACRENDKVFITSFVNKNYLNIIVKDSGCGMDKETIHNIEIPFFTTKEKGTGLGVSLSREIITSHKGKLTYSSVLNKGTTVKIILPLNNSKDS